MCSLKLRAAGLRSRLADRSGGIRRAITPQTRAIVLVHPNNPTGHFTKPWEAEELARICREFDLSLIVDEVFLDYSLARPFWLNCESSRQLCRRP